MSGKTAAPSAKIRTKPMAALGTSAAAANSSRSGAGTEGGVEVIARGFGAGPGLDAPAGGSTDRTLEEASAVMVMTLP